jgi:hypothetical protein
MLRKFLIGTAVFAALSASAFGQAQHGTADEAKAMLLKAVAAVKVDKTKALDMFNKGEGGFLDRDLYPFCGNVSDGRVLAVANPAAKPNIGKDVRTLKDATGKAYGKDLFAATRNPEGQISDVGYMLARPGVPKPVAKVTFVTKVGDLFCGVGYYFEFQQ